MTTGIPIPGSHGGSVHTIELARGLVRRGHELHLVAQAGEPGTTAETADWLQGIRLYPVRPWLAMDQLQWTARKQVRRIAERVGPEIVIERFHAFGGTGLLAARALGVPAVAEVHTPARPYPGSWRDRLDALSLIRPIARWRRAQMEMASAFYGQAALVMPEEYREGYVDVVNGADTERFQPGPPTSNDGPLRCVYLSSFRAWHGAEDLVRAVARCVELGVDIQVSFLGHGPRWDAARAVARSAGVEDRVEFPGAVPHLEVPARLAAADVGLAPFNLAAHPALQLGWYWSPLKLFEFLAAGLPIVTVDIEYMREHLTGAARFYPSGDIEKLARSIASLAADRATVRTMGQEARRLATTRFSWDRQTELVEELLERVRTRSAGGR